jgi:hypothetical protein
MNIACERVVRSDNSPNQGATMNLQDIDVFGFFTKKKPVDPLEEFIFVVYGNPPPPKTADLEEAINIATDEILMGVVKRQEVQREGEVLYSIPVPYSTHDLALSIATGFFAQSRYIQSLRDFHVIALIQAIQWAQEGLVVPVWVDKFAEVLSKLYEPEL